MDHSNRQPPGRPAGWRGLLAAGLLFCLIPSPASAQGLTLANPEWNITLSDFGYSDFLLDNTPGFQGREYLSGEWGAAVAYQLVGGGAVAPQWFDPQFLYPDWQTGSPFRAITPLTQTGLNADNLPIAQSVIASDDLEITLRYEMLDTVVGTPMGVTPASAAGTPVYVPSSRYVLKQTATIRNVSSTAIANLQLIQFLHGLQSQRGVYDNRAHAGPLSAFQYDTTLAGVDAWAVGAGSSSDGLEDFIGFHAGMAPSAIEIGHYGIEGNGVDDHWSGKPSDGVHRSVENNWTTPPYSSRQGTDSFTPAQRWIAGAQRWELGTLNPGQSTGLDVVLSLRTGTRVSTGTTMVGGCNGGSGVPGGIDYDFSEVTSEGSCFGGYSQADDAELSVRVAAGEFEPVTFLTPGGPVQMWEVSFSGAFAGSVELTFGYDPLVLPPGFDESELCLYHFTGGAWQQLAGVVDTLTHKITVSVTSLSPFALGVSGTAATHAISAGASPAGAGTVTGGGTYADGSSVSLAATPEAGFAFVNWTEGATVVSTSPTYTFTATGSRTLVANFASVGLGNVPVTTTSLPANGGTTSGDGAYAPGASVTVVATPAAGYKFSKWIENDVVVSTAASYTFVADQSRTLTAKFKPVYTLVLTADPANGGELEGDPFYELGELAKLKAKPDSGYAFVQWTQNGLPVSTDPNFQFNMTGNRELVGHFALGNRIETSSIPPHAGATTGAGVYPDGAPATLVASPQPGYVFLYWSDSLAPDVPLSTSATYTYTPFASEALVANFGLGPEIAVEQPAGTDLVSGAALVDYGSVSVGGAGVSRTFTVRNTGPHPLTLFGVGVSGGNATDFAVDTTGMPGSIPGGSSTTFTVTFTPGAVGSRTTTLEILSDDDTEATFTIGLEGTGQTAPPTAARLDVFRAISAPDGRVHLTWNTLVEVRTLGFLLERRSADGSWQPLGAAMIPAAGADLRPHAYEAVDVAAGAPPATAYRLVEVDMTGRKQVLAETKAVPAVATTVGLAAGGPRLRLQGLPRGAVLLESATAVTGPWSRHARILLDDAGAATWPIETTNAESVRFYRAWSD